MYVFFLLSGIWVVVGCLDSLIVSRLWVISITKKRKTIRFQLGKMSLIGLHANQSGTIPILSCPMGQSLLEDFFRIDAEKIEFQDGWEAEQGIRVDGLLVVQLVYISTATRQLPGQPNAGLVLFLYFLSDKIPNMHKW